MRWLNLARTYHKERERERQFILMHVYGIQKDDTDEPISRVAMKMQTQKTDLWTQRGKDMVGQMERVVWKHIYYHM